MSTPYIGEIRIFGFNFPPYGWAFCNGQLLPLSQNTALFSILGTTYGGDGRSNFALPNLQGTIPMFWGNGPGLSPRTIGETDGQTTVALNQNQASAHSHTINAYLTGRGTNVEAPSATASLAESQSGNLYKSAATATTRVALSPNTLPPAPGASQPHNNLMPYLPLNFCIALQGDFPPRP